MIVRNCRKASSALPRLHDREQAAAAYGNNAARLRALKRRFDPDRIFASAIPLPEGESAAVTLETHSPRAITP